MFSFPLSFILFPYAAVLLFMAVMSVIYVAHLIRHGATTGVSFIVTFLFLAGSAGIIFGTWYALQGTDWTQPINIVMPSLSFGQTSLSL